MTTGQPPIGGRFCCPIAALSLSKQTLKLLAVRGVLLLGQPCRPLAKQAVCGGSCKCKLPVQDSAGGLGHVGPYHDIECPRTRLGSMYMCSKARPECSLRTCGAAFVPWTCPWSLAACGTVPPVRLCVLYSTCCGAQLQLLRPLCHVPIGVTVMAAPRTFRQCQHHAWWWNLTQSYQQRTHTHTASARTHKAGSHQCIDAGLPVCLSCRHHGLTPTPHTQAAAPNAVEVRKT